jgi:hypothetical protein
MAHGDGEATVSLIGLTSKAGRWEDINRIDIPKGEFTGIDLAEKHHSRSLAGGDTAGECDGAPIRTHPLSRTVVALGRHLIGRPQPLALHVQASQPTSGTFGVERWHSACAMFGCQRATGV